MTTWRTVPVTPDHRMVVAFAAEIRRQSALLPAGSFTHEPLQPLWAAVLAAAPEGPIRPVVPSSAVESYNAGVHDVLALADACAAAIEAKRERPLHHGFAIEALQALVTEAAVLIIPTKPDTGASPTFLPIDKTPRSPAPAAVSAGL